jgi:hypothetical protein
LEIRRAGVFSPGASCADKLGIVKTEKTAGLAMVLSFGRRKTAEREIRKKSVHGICLMRKPTGATQNPNLNLWAKRNTQAAATGFWNWTP